MGDGAKEEAKDWECAQLFLFKILGTFDYPNG